MGENAHSCQWPKVLKGQTQTLIPGLGSHGCAGGQEAEDEGVDDSTAGWTLQVDR